MRLGDPHEVGRLMRERRKRLGFTLEQMAEAVGVSPITIMRIELGRVGYIHEKTAKALEVPTKITHRMVSVPVGVMPDGTEKPIADLAAMPPEMRLQSRSGDAEALAPVKPVKQAHRAPKRRNMLVVAQAVPAKKKADSVAKRALLWLAGKV